MKTNFMMKGLFLLALGGMVFVSSCNDDDDPVVDPLVGNYKLTSAIYLGQYNPADGSTSEVSMSIAPIPDEIPPTAPITELIAGVLNGVSECVGSDGVTPDASQVQIEFREDGSLWFTCDGEGAESSGSWSKADATTVTLNIAPTDNIPTGLSLTLSNIVIAGSNLSGRIDGFPMPRHLGYDLGAPLPDEGGPNIQILSISMVITKQ